MDKASLLEQITRIAEHYGLPSQMDKAQEEMGELISAISRVRSASDDTGWVSDGSKEWLNFMEELADVYIMVCQLVHLSNSKETFELFVRNKIYRQLARINTGNEGEGHA